MIILSVDFVNTNNWYQLSMFLVCSFRIDILVILFYQKKKKTLMFFLHYAYFKTALPKKRKCFLRKAFLNVKPNTLFEGLIIRLFWLLMLM